MKRLFFTLFLTGSLMGKADAQEAPAVVEPLQTGAAQFLTLPTDARSAAMGGTGVALSGNAQAVFHNAATVFGADREAGISYTYAPWMRDFTSGYQWHTVGGYSRLGSRNAVVGGFRYLGCPSLTDNQQQKVKARDWSVEAGYAYRLAEGFSVSATARYIYSALGELNGNNGASTAAFDLGVFYHRAFPGEVYAGQWSVGVQAANFGPKLSYKSGKESLPAMVKAGGAVECPFRLIHRISLTADVACRMQPSDVRAVSVSAGAEYSCLDVLFLRGGYHFGDEKKADNSYATVGAGLSVYGVQLDFSWLLAGKDCAFRNTWWLSAGYSF